MTDPARALRKCDLTDEQCIEAFKALELTSGNKSQAARNMNMNRHTFIGRVDAYHRRNLGGEIDATVLPGMEIKALSETRDAEGKLKARSVKTGPQPGPESQVPEDYLIDRATIQTNGQGQITQQWLKLKRDAGQIITAIDGIKLAVDEIEFPVRKIKYPKTASEGKGMLNLHPLADLHLGLFAWGRETDGPSWDLKTAIKKYKRTMESLMARAPAAEIGIVLGGGDLLHADNSLNRTTKSGNVLDVDTRYSKVLAQACALLVYQTELARAKYPKVIVRILPGNHDEHSAVAVTWFMQAYFKDDDRVEVDTSPSEFWYHQWGKVMLAGNHGHNAKLTDLPMIMANRRAAMWGKTEFRYGHGFHIHHKERHVFEDGGVIVESHQSPSASDAYHASNKYVSGRSMCVVTYDKTCGEIGRATLNLM